MSLSDGAKKFLNRFPKLFHVSQAPDVATLKKHGLLSTSAILDLFNISSGDRYQFESTSRKNSREFVSEEHGTFVINDQAPLNMTGLQKCLVDLTPAQWIAELNRRVFFFPSQAKVERLASAVKARQRQKFILEFDTADLLCQGEQCFTFAHINLGFTLKRPAARGLNTFRPLSEFQSISRTPVAEVTAARSISPDIPFRVITAIEQAPA